MYEIIAASIGVVAGLITLGGFIPYILSIFKRETIPNCASWWIWTVIGIIVGSAYYVATDNYYPIWVPLSYIIGPLFVAILSLKYGEGEYLGKLDIFCLIGALVSLLLWVLSQSALVALCFLLIIDIFGAIPTFIKSYYYPLSENLTAWLLFSFGSILNLFSITQWDFASVAYPIYLAIGAAAITLTNLIGRQQISTER